MLLLHTRRTQGNGLPVEARRRKTQEGKMASESLCTDCPGFFFCLIILAYDLSRSWQRIFCPVFLSAVRAVTAHCKLPLCPPPGPPKRLLHTKEIDKGKDRRKLLPVPYSSPADAMNGVVGRNSGSSPAPSSSASTLRSSSRSQRSRSSHSDTSLPASASSSAGGTILPTCQNNGRPEMTDRRRHVRR